ncbi:GNAT family N-acetyltransferase [Ruegeria sp. 2205SS24-7]|uniref:GNAT family N-acetyltransferase n=1 Tax=Ruegeria discodermiae TaxID=3064389 RepID=UPI0027421B0A|nr:GNAT family N-acetyltransferase [Ruegeria sp. 2205SS24-7]MDP5219651.1 GNAT family N-acetyltransferase [Ruegeria sp. 2205SS24-7]
MVAELVIGRDDVRAADVRDLLLRHFALMRESSPEESCHVMEPDALQEADVTLISARQAGTVLGIGALNEIASGHGELKSMHTAAEARGRGIARAILQALITEAQDRGLHRLSLETGSDPIFAPARALYAAHGFSECPPFGDYQLDPLSTFMTRLL